MPKGRGYPPKFTAKADGAPAGVKLPGIPAESPRKAFRKKGKAKKKRGYGAKGA